MASGHSVVVGISVFVDVTAIDMPKARTPPASSRVEQVDHRRTEMLDGGNMAERAGRAEVADTQRQLECKAPGHELPIDGLDGSVGQWTFVGGERPFEHLRLAVRSVDGRALGTLGAADLFDDPGPLRQDLDQPPVDLVDPLTKGLQAHFIGPRDNFGIGGLI